MKARILILLILCGGLLQGQTHRPSVTAGRLTGNNTENNWTLGRLGIGTTSPLKPLHLVGVGYVNGSIGIGTSTPAVGLVVHDDIISLTNTGTASALRFYEPSGGGINYTAFKAKTQDDDVTYTLPAADGSNGQALQTDGSGTLSWGAGTQEQLYVATVTLSTSQVNDLGTAKELIAAPGANKYISIVDISMYLTVSVALNAGSQVLQIKIGNSAFVFSNSHIQLSYSSPLQPSENAAILYPLNTAVTAVLSSGANPTGTATMTFSILYRIVSI